MILKGYFDGTSEDGAITLASVFGSAEQWNRFEKAWKASLDNHGACYLHTTDAVALQGEYSKKRGWSRESVDALISDCVGVIAEHIEIPDRIPYPRSSAGLRAFTLSILLGDFALARKTNRNLPNSVTELCATESVSFGFKLGRQLNATSYYLYFDQGEPFCGHIIDRMRNKKSRMAIPSLTKVEYCGPANMRSEPALQMADLFAWCISHNERVSRPWHRSLHSLPWDSLYLDYELLLNPIKGTLEVIKSWRLPRRKLDPPEPIEE